MNIQFDSKQQHQLTAISSVIQLLEGQPLAASGGSITLQDGTTGNKLCIDHETLLANLRKVQQTNQLPLSEHLNYQQDEGFLQFSIEMETGTGKTYTFLRTIYELHKVYGFKKYLVVVPGVAIREGLLSHIRLSYQHLQELYQHPPLHYAVYERGKNAPLRNFALSDAIELLIINIESFARDGNVINQPQENGAPPLTYVQNTRPILILDEPQNLETELRRQAIARLKPLFALGYSATHRNLYHLLYRLSPAQAYQMDLVKQIEVEGIELDNTTHTGSKIHLLRIEQGKKQLRAWVEIRHRKQEVLKLRLSTGDDLYKLSGNHPLYKDAYLLHRIDAESQSIAFANGLRISLNEYGHFQDQLMKRQIERTIYYHFEKVKKLSHAGQPRTKVLSLFFIDSVANYRSYQPKGESAQGKFAIWFEEIFAQYSQQYPGLIPYPPHAVHNGYFASDKARTIGNKAEIWIDSKEKNTRKDEEAYTLIMRDKERLLSPDEPLQFIFSHSALREGWDNPNVFQICTLNETHSAIKKRQEIGRGLRLAVDETGRRLAGKQYNTLTIIANQSYEAFSKDLQKEIRAETAGQELPPVHNARERLSLSLHNHLSAQHYPELFACWPHLSPPCCYKLHLHEAQLIEEATALLAQMPPVYEASLRQSSGLLLDDQGRVKSKATHQETVPEQGMEVSSFVPDPLAFLQEKLWLKRSSILAILQRSGRLGELGQHPILFLEQLTTLLRPCIWQHMVQGLSYHLVTDRPPLAVEVFETEQKDYYTHDLLQPADAKQTLFNYIPVNHSGHRKFALQCIQNKEIRFFFRLPQAFQIPTPLGTYTPDWAVIDQRGQLSICDSPASGSVTRQHLLLRTCAHKYFECLGISYRVV